MLEEIKEEVLKSNTDLVRLGLVLFTWGNASAFDPDSGLVVIKPSGVPYEALTADDMAVVDLEGKKVEGKYNPSSDTPTHIEIYKAFGKIKSVVHTHSKWASVWAQACRAIPALGTTHADNFFGEVPCTRSMTEEEIRGRYERNTGLLIVETFREKRLDPVEMGAVLVANHGPFCWGTSCAKAVENAAVLEYAAETAYATLRLNPGASMQNALLEKHYLRKHGDGAYYGQK